MIRTRTSFAIATSILRMVAACCASFESNWMRSSLVTPSTMAATVGPNSPVDVVERELGVLDRVVQQRGGDGDVVESELGDDGGHGQRVGDVRLARSAHLAAVGPLGHLVGVGDARGAGLGVPRPEGGDQRGDLLHGRRDVIRSYANAAKAADAELYPAGLAWQAAWRRSPTLPLYGPDGFHPSPLGTYLAAIVVLAGLTDEPPLGFPIRIDRPGFHSTSRQRGRPCCKTPPQRRSRRANERRAPRRARAPDRPRAALSAREPLRARRARRRPPRSRRRARWLLRALVWPASKLDELEGEDRALSVLIDGAYGGDLRAEAVETRWEAGLDGLAGEALRRAAARRRARGEGGDARHARTARKGALRRRGGSVGRGARPLSRDVSRRARPVQGDGRPAPPARAPRGGTAS